MRRRWDEAAAGYRRDARERRQRETASVAVAAGLSYLPDGAAPEAPRQRSCVGCPVGARLLANLGFATQHAGQAIPTVAGLLLVGAWPQDRIESATLKCAFFYGQH